MIYCAFFTVGTLYEQEAARLRRSLDRLGLPHDIEGVESKGSWAANAAMTASFYQRMLDKHAGAIVALDADAIVWKRPALFDQLSPSQYDIAVHYRKGTEMLNGTVWLGNTVMCKALIEDYRRRVEDNPQEKNEQIQLDRAIKANDGVRLFRLPASYCWIHDLMAADLDGDEPVIEHLQASRVATRSTLLPSRMRRLAKIEGMV